MTLGGNVQTATTLEWLYRKGLLRSNEFITGEALALLIEWRVASFCAPDSTIIFARRCRETRPLQIAPIEKPLDEILIGGGDDGLPLDLDKHEIYNETIAERLFRNVTTGEELLNIERLFKKALPERPDLMVILGQAVINRLSIHELPYTDVPLICSAIYILKEFWRERLLARAINDAVGCIAQETRRPARNAEGESRSALAA